MCMCKCKALEILVFWKTLRRYKMDIPFCQKDAFNPLQPGVAFLYPLKSGGIEKQQRAVMGLGQNLQTSVKFIEW